MNGHPSLAPIDLGFRGLPRAIGVYPLDTPDGPALFDCGPQTTLPRLRAGLRDRGLGLDELRHLLLSHVHLDHAGAAGAIVRENPSLQVWVSAVGAPHLIDPTRLEASARRLYGEQFDALWGGLVPVPAANIRVADGEVLGFEAFPTPGHASHHVCYAGNGTLLAGDACGVRLPPAEYVFPVSPPPDIDIEAWHASIAAIERRAPERLALVHFGVVGDVGPHLARLRTELDRWAGLVRSGLDCDSFVAAARTGAGADAPVYDAIAPYEQSWQGLLRYFVKRGELAPA